MFTYVCRRLLAVVPTLLAVLFIVVLLTRLIPGNVVDVLLSDQPQGNSKADRAAIEHRLGLDDPIYVQFAKYTANVARGDFGRSLWSQKPVAETIFSRLPVSLELAVMSLGFSIVAAIGIGILSAIRQGSVLDYVLRSAAVAALSVPSFAIATVVIVLPALWFGWTPPLFYKSFGEDPSAHLLHLVTPAVIIGLGSASLMRLTRTAMLEVLRQDYIRTARAKGLVGRVVIFRHALKNAMIPVVTLLGLQVSVAISGSVVMEQMFNIPGLGRLLIDALAVRDYPTIQAVTLITAVGVILVNLLVDISYVFFDPRIKVA